MKLLEYQGKELFRKYGIEVPKGEVLSPQADLRLISFPCVLKSQVLAGNRKAHGGIVLVHEAKEYTNARDQVFQTEIEGFIPEHILAEERIQAAKELYVSFSYASETRGPVLAISDAGGSGIEQARVFPVDVLVGVPEFFLRNAVIQAGIPFDNSLVQTIKALWKLFLEEKALIAEINPLFQTADGRYIAGDAKIVLDDSVADPSFRPYLELEGDIAVLASGGGASLINLDALMHYGGKPANYVEYSGNPPSEVVEELTMRVFSKPDLKGAWVVGGTANFTDIYETMKGFVQGLRKVQPKPTYPIVIRRDGPRQQEAFAMLREVAEKEGYDFHLYGPEVSMSESAKRIVELAYGK